MLCLVELAATIVVTPTSAWAAAAEVNSLRTRALRDVCRGGEPDRKSTRLNSSHRL